MLIFVEKNVLFLILGFHLFWKINMKGNGNIENSANNDWIAYNDW